LTYLPFNSLPSMTINKMAATCPVQDHLFPLATLQTTADKLNTHTWG
jgi:hypothetical protein